MDDFKAEFVKAKEGWYVSVNESPKGVTLAVDIGGRHMSPQGAARALITWIEVNRHMVEEPNAKA